MHTSGSLVHRQLQGEWGGVMGLIPGANLLSPQAGQPQLGVGWGEGRSLPHSPHPPQEVLEALIKQRGKACLLMRAACRPSISETQL